MSSPDPASLLAPLDRYQHLFSGAPSSASLRLHRGSQELYYLGTPHTWTEDDDALVALELRWERFALAHPRRGVRVVIEGRLRPPAWSRTEAIEVGGGEGGLLAWLAHRRGYPVSTVEPDPTALFRDQLQHFDHALVSRAYLQRGLLLWLQRGSTRPLRTFLYSLWPWEELGCVEELEGLLWSTREGDPRHMPSREQLHRELDPLRRTTPEAEVLERDALLRDALAVHLLARAWEAGESLFVVLGIAHLVVQEPALLALLPHEGEAALQVEEQPHEVA